MRLWWLRRRRPRRRPRGEGPVAGAGHVAHLVQQAYCAKLDDDWPRWYGEVGAILRGVVRASSRRVHEQRAADASIAASDDDPGMLDLKRLYWNARRFGGGKRKGKCPYEHLGLDLPSYDFWDLVKQDFDDVLAETKAVAARKARSRLIARVTAA